MITIDFNDLLTPDDDVFCESDYLSDWGVIDSTEISMGHISLAHKKLRFYLQLKQ